MKAEIDIKTMIAIVASVGVLGGFYYTTQMRLDNIEQDIIQLQADIKKTNKLVRRANK
tara:strand:+ start:1500 stop:1673 length:174 start_codon:yes stop_codon:yes gene_type:complete